MDGYSLIKAIRVLGPGDGGNTPAIALTAHARSEDRRLAMLCGFDVHVARPVEPGELVAVVARLAWRTRGVAGIAASHPLTLAQVAGAPARPGSRKIPAAPAAINAASEFNAH